MAIEVAENLAAKLIGAEKPWRAGPAALSEEVQKPVHERSVTRHGPPDCVAGPHDRTHEAAGEDDVGHAHIMPRYRLAVATGFPRWSGMVVKLTELGKQAAETVGDALVSVDFALPSPFSGIVCQLPVQAEARRVPTAARR